MNALNRNNSGLCWILLHYAQQTHRHYFHLYHFVEQVAARCPVRVIFLSAEGRPQLRNVDSVHVLPPGNPVKRWFALRSLIRAAHDDGFRTFYCHYAYAAARIAGHLTRRAGGRTLLWHCIQVHQLDRMTGASIRQKVMWRMTLNRIDHLVTGSSAMAQYYQSRFHLSPQTTLVVPNFIDLSRFQPADSERRAELRREAGIADDAEVMLYLHEMEQGRCQHLPGIIDTVLRRRPRAVFILAGDGRYRQELQRQVERLNWGQRVQFTGRVPNADVPRYFGMADVYLVTSDFEAFSRVHLEAMAMGVPFVSTDGGGPIRAYTPPQAQDFIVPLNEIRHFPALIDRILDDPDTSQLLARAGLHKVQDYSEENVLPLFLRQVCGWPESVL